jgi:two-component system, OmpR family, sensor histidine kinase VicK
MDVVTSVKSVMEQVNISAKMKKIQIKHEFLHSPVYVKANKTKLERVFQNLMTNAIKFSNAGSAISVCVKQEVFSVLIKISDNGIGIPLAMQSEVFNKFTTAKRRGTQGESTTGLGLFISKRIVDVHQGQIWLDSKQDEGTTFYIRLPLLED